MADFNNGQNEEEFPEISKNSSELLEVIDEYGRELNNIKRIKIDAKINKIYNEAKGEILRASLPSLVLLILSFFVGVADIPFMGNIFESISKFINPEQQVLNTEIQPVTLWWFPFIIFLVFIFCAFRANIVLRKEFADKNREASEASITRIIDRYSGIVDGLGTALPLLGAAVLLISIEKGPAVFLGFAVPFEIKSILILAIAKLFDSVFDALALKYQEIQEIINNVERAFIYINQSSNSEPNYNQQTPAPVIIESNIIPEQIEKIYETMKASEDLGKNIKSLVTEINNLKLPDEKILKELQTTSHSLGETIKSLGNTMMGLKDTNVVKSLDNLVNLFGKKENQK
jgi:regulator of replication initiation timing